LGLIGCTGKELPSDLPRLYPCKVRIENDKQPVAKASVIFSPQQGKWSAMGETDENGNLLLKTNGIYTGVPEGRYKVLVSKVQIDPIDATKELTENNMKVIPLIDPLFGDINKTPLEFEVKSTNNIVTFQVR
jgi:hypothetical protein